MHPLRFHSHAVAVLFGLTLLSAVSAQEIVSGSNPTDPEPLAAATVASPKKEVTGITRIEPFMRREPVLPVKLPDFELTTLDVSKEIVFHVGDRTFVSRVPVLVYLPVNRPGRAEAVDRLIEARAILVRSAAAGEVTTADLAGVRDMIEQAITSLKTPDLGDMKPAEITKTHE